MKRSGFSPPERLIFDLQGLIAEIKNQFFTNEKTPMNDNDTIIHKLCVRLENVLRYGAREKYTFMGTKKDYWNYVSETLPKDEVVRFVNSISELKTNQGKGRALLRQCLMEKCLADTIQRCSIEEKTTKEYYVTDSILRNANLLQTLVHSLYDLNSIDMKLPHKGYDLDRSFPSFSRKTFGETRSRRASVESVKLEYDPVLQIHNNISELAAVINMWTGQESVSTKTLGNSPTLKENIDKVKLVSSLVKSLQHSALKQVDSLKGEISKLHDDKRKSDSDYELRLKQLHDRYASIQNIDTSVTEDKFKDLYDKLVATELEMKTTKSDFSVLTDENSKLKSQLESADQDKGKYDSEKEDMVKTIEQCRIEIENLKKCEHCSESTNKILEQKMSELQKANHELMSKEKHLSDQLTLAASTLSARENDLSTLKEAFQQSTGLVVSSFQELRQELDSQLKEKTDHLKEATSLREELSVESKTLHLETQELQKQNDTFKEKMLEESKKREAIEKTVGELKEKLTEGLKHKSYLQQCISEIWLSVSYEDEKDGNTDSPSDETDGYVPMVSTLTDAVFVKQEQEKVLQRLDRMKQYLKEVQSTSLQHEQNFTELNRQTSVKSEHFEQIRAQLQQKTEESINLQTQIEDLRKDNELFSKNDNRHADDMVTMTTTIATLNQQLVEEENKHEKLCEEFRTTQYELQHQSEQLKMSITKAEKLEEAKTLLEEEVQRLGHTVVEMSQKEEQLVNEMESYNIKESSYIKEIKLLKQEIDNALNINERETQSMRFQLSTLEMKCDSANNELKEAQKIKDELAKDLEERNEKIDELQQKQTSGNVKLQSENEALIKEIDALNKLVHELQEKFTVSEKEIALLKVQVTKVAKEKEDEKATRINASNLLNNAVQERKSLETKYKDEIALLNEDIEELKDHLVNVTKDKQELWQQKDTLEFELRQKVDERWVTDSEILQCTTCLAQFSLTLRKHHCRICGQIFCHNCSNRWLKTAQSRKKIRACNVCADAYVEKHGDKNVDQNDLDKTSDTLSQLEVTSVSSQYEGFDQYLGGGGVGGGYGSGGGGVDDSHGNFEVLDSSNLSRSGGFDSSERIVLDASDIQLEMLHPIVTETDTSLRGDDNSTTDPLNSDGELVTDRHTSDDDTPTNQHTSCDDTATNQHTSDNDLETDRLKRDDELTTDRLKNDNESTSHEELTSREKVQFTIGSGKRYFLPILIDEKMLEMKWEFSSKPKDVGFGVAYKAFEEESDEKLQTIIPFSRYMSHKQVIHSKMTLQNEGVYYLCFSNAYSRFTTKTVMCFISVNR